MQTLVKTEIKNLVVDFYEVKAGWMSFKLTLDEQVFDSSFSDVFDPILDFKNWLEAAAIGVQKCSFSYDPEGNDIQFEIERISYERGNEFTISEPYENGQIFLKGFVDRKQVVKAFYYGLLNFANSDKFKSEGWEIEYIYERLSKALNWDKEKTINEFCKLDRIELGKALFIADPSYTISFPNAKDINESIQLFVDEALKKKTNKVIERIETPTEWQIPDDYDFWKFNKRKKFIEECLNEKTNGSSSGTKISDFRSEIIEKYLKEE